MKKSLSVMCKILRHFVNTFTAYEEFSVLHREYSTQTIHMQLSIKTKDFFSIFFCTFKHYIKFLAFSKKKLRLRANIFRNYGLRKRWSDKCLKSALSQYSSTRNMVNAIKHCSNLNNGSFTKFFDYCKGN